MFILQTHIEYLLRVGLALGVENVKTRKSCLVLHTGNNLVGDTVTYTDRYLSVG